MTMWSSGDGALFRQELKRSSDETARALAYDMQPVLDETCLKLVKVPFATVMNNKMTVRGSLISLEQGRSLIRDKGGVLYSTATPPVYVQSKSKKKTGQCQQGEQI